VIHWPGGSAVDGDALVVAPWPETVRQSLESHDRAVLAEIGSPFFVGATRGIPLNDLFRDDPSAADAEMTKIVEDIRGQMHAALDAGADGIFYRLHGATPAHTTPMQYGGQFLEVDRELLEDIAQARFNVIFVVGDEGTYLDFVSDLPAHAFAWDSDAAGASVADVRGLRQGALATYSDESDILMMSNIGDVTDYLEKRNFGTAL
jgi:hypothetical protein